MELGLQFEDILCYEATAAISSAHEESLETAIPEYCPDIARIVEATGRLTIREKQLNEERCTISGSVKVTVLYTSEEATGLRSLTMSVPFSCVMDDRTLTRCGTVCAEGRVLLTEARAVTSRKLYIKVLPEITAVGYRAVKRRLCTGTQEESTIRTQCRNVELSLLTAISEKGFSFTDDVLLDDGCLPEDLLLHRMCPSISSVQRLGNKLMIKGDMWFHAIYRSEDQGLRQYCGSLPFSQILDVAELPENAEYILCPQIGECDARILRTDGGNGFGLTAHVDVCIKAYQQRTVNYLADIYSTRCDTSVERQEVTIPLAAPARTVSQDAQLRLEFDGSQPFISVTAVDCSPVEVAAEEARTALRATLHVRLLYLDESGAPVSTERTVEVGAETGEVGGPVTASCCQITMQFSGSACQVRIPVDFSIGCEGEKTISGITAVTLTDVAAASGPSLILCRMGCEETLWDVAKRYHTDEDAIRAANQLENDEDAAKYMLLIPRIR